MVSLWLIQPAQTGRTTPHSTIHPIIPKAELLSFTGMLKDNKIQLKWIVNRNRLVDRFELEKSTDRKKFFMAALVFCTDVTETDYYEYIDRSIEKKVYYRIKIINKDGTESFSSTLEIDPSAAPESIEQTKTPSYDDYC